MFLFIQFGDNGVETRGIKEIVLYLQMVLMVDANGKMAAAERG
jgi:hypothetical protein